MESSADGDEDGSREEPIKPESDKTEEGCGRLALEEQRKLKRHSQTKTVDCCHLKHVSTPGCLVAFIFRS